jgi:sodium-dependent dicarboxylate transporter 2/3/5
MAIQRTSSGPGQLIGLWLGLVFFLFLMAFPVDPGNVPASRLAAVALLMATWWVSDAIPLFATALLPLVLFPILGIMGGRATAPIYFNSTIVLFIGGFMIALTMEKWNLHRRIALTIIHWVGGGPARIVLGFMLAAAFLSMWISNTATAVMMVPIGLAIVLQIEEKFGAAKTHKFTVGLMLGIAYACSVGGLTTLVGTPPNLSFVRIFQILFPDAPPIAFGQWIVMALPIGVTMLFVAWILITRVFYRTPEEVTVDDDVIVAERSRKGGPGGLRRHGRALGVPRGSAGGDRHDSRLVPAASRARDDRRRNGGHHHGVDLVLHPHQGSVRRGPAHHGS